MVENSGLSKAAGSLPDQHQIKHGIAMNDHSCKKIVLVTFYETISDNKSTIFKTATFVNFLVSGFVVESTRNAV